MAARSPSVIPSARRARAFWSRCFTKCGAGMRRRESQPCASAAAWESRFAWSAELRRKTDMARVAIVTGGTRGIGRAVSIALKEAGCEVVANYARDDGKAESFSSETGIAARKWDVSDLAACAAAVNVMLQEFGPVDILVNNAGI